MAAQIIGARHWPPARGLHREDLEGAVGAAEQQAAVDGGQRSGRDLLGRYARSVHAEALAILELELRPDVRVEGAGPPLELGRRPARVEETLAGLDLLRVRRR